MSGRAGCCKTGDSDPTVAGDHPPKQPQQTLNIKNAMSVQMREGLDMNNIDGRKDINKLQIAKMRIKRKKKV
jgi:hypothetical protein